MKPKKIHWCKSNPLFSKRKRLWRERQRHRELLQLFNKIIIIRDYTNILARNLCLQLFKASIFK